MKHHFFRFRYVSAHPALHSIPGNEQPADTEPVPFIRQIPHKIHPTNMSMTARFRSISPGIDASLETGT